MEIETTKEGIVKIKKVKDHIILESKNGNKIGVEFNKKGFVIGYKGKRYDVKDDLISLDGYTLHKNEVDSNKSIVDQDFDLDKLNDELRQSLEESTRLNYNNLIACGLLKTVLEDEFPKRILTPKGESDLKALEMVFDTELSLNVSQRKAIDICLDKVDFMLRYNPCPVNPNQRKKEYHDYWESIKLSLEKLKQKH
ncbi:hypothetical protein [Polaribacter sp.]|uniref:hypothetical protein n=1 Tax=Polaribacter sp. TaxID=1920175 RepID=UPI003F6BAEA6